MSLEDRTLRHLDWLAQNLNHRGIRPLVRELVADRAQAAGVRLLDRVVSRLVGHELRTAPRPSARRVELPAPQAHREDTPSTRPSARPAISDRPSTRPRLSSRPLRERFGIDRIVLVPRTPFQAFAYWETSAETVEAELRLIDLERGSVLSRTPVAASQGRAYLPLPGPDRAYAAELGLPGEGQGKRAWRSRPLRPSQFDRDAFLRQLDPDPAFTSPGSRPTARRASQAPRASSAF